MDTEHEFEVWQNGGSVAWVNCGDRARAVAEISHYAAVYSKDGPVEVFEVKRVPFDPARSEAQPSGYDGSKSLGERLFDAVATPDPSNTQAQKMGEG